MLPKNIHLQKYCLVYFLTFFAYVHFLGCYAQAVAHPFLFMIQFIHQHVYFWIIIYFRDFLCNICLLNEDKYLVQHKHKDMLRYNEALKSQIKFEGYIYSKNTNILFGMKRKFWYFNGIWLRQKENIPNTCISLVFHYILPV